MPLPPEILDSIHEVELRLVDARRRAGKGLNEGRSGASSKGTPLDATGVLAQELAGLWLEYRKMTQP